MTPSQLAQLGRAQAGHGRDSHEPWADAISTHPLDDLTANAHTLLLSPDMLTDVELEHAYQRRVVGYHETIRARRPTAGEHASLQIGAADPVLVMTRITRTTTRPIGELTLIARSDRFEIDYLIDS